MGDDLSERVDRLESLLDQQQDRIAQQEEAIQRQRECIRHLETGGADTDDEPPRTAPVVNRRNALKAGGLLGYWGWRRRRGRRSTGTGRHRRGPAEGRLHGGDPWRGDRRVEGVENVLFGEGLDIFDDGDGTVTVENTVQGTSDTHTDVSDDGSTVVPDTGDIDFTTGLSVTDQGDGTEAGPADGHVRPEVVDDARPDGEARMNRSVRAASRKRCEREPG